MALNASTVLVTGATGFIGGRLVERLILEEGARVRVLLRDFAHAPRVARFPVEMIGGSVTDLDAVDRAAAGCDVIVHCAFGNSGTPEEKRAATIAGTEAVAEAARRAGVKRLVHLSTISVYGLPGDGDLDETAPRRFCGYSVLGREDRGGMPGPCLPCEARPAGGGPTADDRLRAPVRPLAHSPPFIS